MNKPKFSNVEIQCLYKISINAVIFNIHKLFRKFKRVVKIIQIERY